MQVAPQFYGDCSQADFQAARLSRGEKLGTDKTPDMLMNVAYHASHSRDARRNMCMRVYICMCVYKYVDKCINTYNFTWNTCEGGECLRIHLWYTHIHLFICIF